MNPINTNIQKPLYCYFGHPKCAGTWMSGFFLGVFHELGLKSYQHQLTLIDNPPKYILEKNLDVLLSQNSSYSKVQTLSNYKGIHLIRDPRDISVSAYFSYRNTHAIGDWKALAEIREKLISQPFDEGLITLIEWNDAFIQHIAHWPYNDPNILEFKIEDLKKDPASSMIQIMDFFDLLDSREENPYFKYKGFINRGLHKLNLPFLFKQDKITKKNIIRIHDSVSFKKLAKGRSFGEVDTASHYRSGADGDWKNHFNEEHKVYFKEKYGQLLIKLGYEKNLDW